MGKIQQDDDLLLSRVRDAFDSASHYCAKFIGFLDPHESAVAKSFAQRAEGASDGCTFLLFGGYDGAQRAMIGVFPPYSQPQEKDFPICAVKIRWRFATLSHRDFLGALMGLGIVRSKIGDILVEENTCTVLVEKTVAPFVTDNLLKVGSAGVVCTVGDVCAAHVQENFKEIDTTIASERLDCVVSAVTGCSRTASAELIAGGLVCVDYMVCQDQKRETCEGATVSIRGHGRFVIDRIGPKTRKGRLAFAARKYL